MHEIKNNKPQDEYVDTVDAVKVTEETEINPAAIIVQDAMELFVDSAVSVAYVEIAPFVYPDLAKSLGQEVSFPVLYGFMPLDIYGLSAYVRKEPSSGQGGWHEAHWYDLHTQEHEESDLRPLDTLIQKIVRTWESCQTQCEKGFPCPLLAEIGIDLDGEVMQACTALRDIETVMGGNLVALDEAAQKFHHDNTEGVSEDKTEEQEDEGGSSAGTVEGFGGAERPSEGEDEGRDGRDSLRLPE